MGCLVNKGQCLFLFSLFLISLIFGCSKTSYPWICANIEGEITENGNESLKDDYYLYVNKNNLLHIHLNDNLKEYTFLIDGASKLYMDFFNLILSLDEKQSYIAGDVLSLFKLASNWKERDSIGIQPMQNCLSEIMALENLDEFNNYLSLPEHFFLFEFFCSFYMFDHPYENEEHVISLIPSSSILSESNYKEYPLYVWQKGLSDVFAPVLSRFGYDESTSRTIIEDALSFESELVIAHSLDSCLINSGETIKSEYVFCSELKDRNHLFFLTDLIESMFGLGDDSFVLIKDQNWFDTFVETWNEENFGKIKNYALFRLIYQGLLYLDSQSFSDLMSLYEQLGRTKYNKQELPIATIVELLPWYISYLYNENIENNETKRTLHDICNSIQDSFLKIINESDQLSGNSKKIFENRIKEITKHLLFPEDWYLYLSDHDMIKEDDNEYLFNAYINCRNYRRELYIKWFNSVPSSKYWSLSPVLLSPSYEKTKNSIYFPITTLRTFQFGNLSYEEKLSKIGFIIAHEMAHSIAFAGDYYYDNYGHIICFDEEVKSDIDSIIESIEDYLRKFRVKKYLLDVDNIAHEFFADICAMQCILNIAKRSNNFDYDLFFNSYAELWCAKYSDKLLTYLIRVESHPLPYIRVNGVLQQFDEFIDYYDIKPGDGMYRKPEERIRFF